MTPPASPLLPEKTMPNVPILRVPFDADDKKFIHEGLDKILASGHLTCGSFTKSFEEEFAKLVGVPHAIATANCTTGLEIIFRALNVKGKTVIVPTNTFIATAFAAIHAGARVIFADADPKTLCLDPKDVAKKIQDDTAAICLVHIGGIITPAVEELKKLCDDKGIALVEDCAHAHGSSYKGVQAGAWGIAGAFSFFPTKPLVSGEGGVITTKDKDLFEKACILRNHGKNPTLKNRISHLGHNWRLSELTALIALQQTKKADKLFASRKDSAKFYDENLKDLVGATPLALPEGLDSTFYKYILWLDEGIDRAALKKKLKEEYQVSLTGEVYDFLCHNEPVWKDEADAIVNINDSFPGAEEAAARHICLPLYPGLTEVELRHVVDSLKTCLKELA